MRTRGPLAALALAAVLAAPGYDAGRDDALPPLPSLPAADQASLASSTPWPPARLCEAIPREAVAEATGRTGVTVDGAGSQCSWRAPSTEPDGPDLVLQGSFIAARSFDVARPSVGATDVAGLGDDAYLVQGDGTAPTLYVRDGSVAFALWLTDAGAPAPEGALTGLARQVLAS